MKFKYKKSNKQKRIALIAHDNMKEELIRWADENRDALAKHFLCGTGTTASLISEKVCGVTPAEVLAFCRVL